MGRIIVAGIGTDVGKTIAAAVLTECLKGSYWKPVESGLADSERVRLLLDKKREVYPPAYSLKAPLSPHHAARLEGRSIQFDKIIPPAASPLIIEVVGGVLVPLSDSCLSYDLFKQWNASWVLVSRHYLGSINHTLLTGEFLKREGNLSGIIFNGAPNSDTERVILRHLQVPLLGRLLPEKEMDSKTIKKYANQWKSLKKTFLTSGTPSLKLTVPHRPYPS